MLGCDVARPDAVVYCLFCGHPITIPGSGAQPVGQAFVNHMAAWYRQDPRCPRCGHSVLEDPPAVKQVAADSPPAYVALRKVLGSISFLQVLSTGAQMELEQALLKMYLMGLINAKIQKVQSTEVICVVEKAKP